MTTSTKSNQTIKVERTYMSLSGYTNTEEEVLFNGDCIFYQSDDWGRRDIVLLSEFENELQSCHTEQEILRMIKKIQKREYVKNKKKKLKEVGFSKAQINMLFGCKTANWKHEELDLKLDLINNSVYPKSLFKELSEAASNAKFNKIAKNWGLDELCEFSHPRKTAYAELIYNLKN